MDLATAITRANVLNEALDGWRVNQLRPDRFLPGTVSWLFDWYCHEEVFTKNTPKTQSDYRKLMNAVCAIEMQNGTFGQRRASAVTATVTEQLFKIFEPRGRRQAVYMVQVCRAVWNWANRFPEKTGIPAQQNPFAGMRKTYTSAGTRPTSRAELMLYCDKARELGFESMATAAMLAFELVQRVWDVFAIPNPRQDPSKAKVKETDIGLRWEHYTPGEKIKVRQSKTDNQITIPLSEKSENGESLDFYPELEAQLARVRPAALSGVIVIEERTGTPYTHRRVSTVHRKICEAAGLPKKMTFTGFRHGGATEIGDAGEADIRSISGHKQLNTAAIYNKASEEKARQIAIRRRAHIDQIVGSERDLSE
ncbi:tyrosine-type recombinase/integrase [Porphyrobacter algicida]|uniref:Tyrosine-type recombinase/integrase n=1 Tax=Qipengyuania algicida TaxID=1836209 RepID=A0A845AL35_9SPHN|nr:tyrosine-type recombinase/integrase [Qipengyuania algicida]MXP30189.1 tyrosine-type recombinase/integrase [Qipengyuania algicida]